MFSTNNTLSFSTIEKQIDSILSTDQGVFLGIDHEDIHFHDYLTIIIFNLSQKYPLHLFMEMSDAVMQQSLVKSAGPKMTPDGFRKATEFRKLNIAEQNKKRPDDEKIQPPYLVAILANDCGVQVKGIDAPEQEIAELHNKTTSYARLIELTMQRSLSHGDKMVPNIMRELKSFSKDDKYILFGGVMHGDVPKKLSINSINVFENTKLAMLATDFSIYTKTKNLAQTEILRPNHTFYYDAKDVKADKVTETKVSTTKKVNTPFTPSFATPLISDKILSEFSLTDRSQASFEKGLRTAANAGRMDELNLFIKHIKNINAQDSNPDKQYTALHLAVMKNQIEAAKALIAAGAKSTIKDKNQKTPLDHAEELGNLAMKNILNGAHNATQTNHAAALAASGSPIHTAAAKPQLTAAAAPAPLKN